MSRPRYDWWGYVKGMIRRYPALCRQYWDLHSQSVTALYGPQGGAGDDARKTERLASCQRRSSASMRRCGWRSSRRGCG